MSARTELEQRFESLLARYRAGRDITPREGRGLQSLHERAMQEYREQPRGAYGDMYVFASPPPRPWEEYAAQLGLDEAATVAEEPGEPEPQPGQPRPRPVPREVMMRLDALLSQRLANPTASGLSQEAIARQLGISRRLVRDSRTRKKLGWDLRENDPAIPAEVTDPKLVYPPPIEHIPHLLGQRARPQGR